MTTADVRKAVKQVYAGKFSVKRASFSDLARGDAYYVDGVKGVDERIAVRVALSTLPGRAILSESYSFS